MNPISLSSAALRRAADLSDEIAAKQAELDAILQGGEPATKETPASSDGSFVTTNGRRFTPAAIEKIRAAQRRRWKLVRKNKAAAAALAATIPAEPVPASS